MEKKPYDALDVSRFVINYCNDKGYEITNLKLQKILYYIQAYYLISQKPPQRCFFNEIEAWDFGPVIPSAYWEYRENGSADIPRISRYLRFYYVDGHMHFRYEKYNEEMLDKDDRELIKKVVDKTSKFSAYELVEKTHKDSPWKNAIKGGKKTVIKEEEIIKYYE